MSASPIARQLCASHAQSIPSKKVLISDPNQMPDVYSSTPGGTLYSTTPGGRFFPLFLHFLHLFHVISCAAFVSIFHRFFFVFRFLIFFSLFQHLYRFRSCFNSIYRIHFHHKHYKCGKQSNYITSIDSLTRQIELLPKVFFLFGSTFLSFEWMFSTINDINKKPPINLHTILLI